MRKLAFHNLAFCLKKLETALSLEMVLKTIYLFGIESKIDQFIY